MVRIGYYLKAFDLEQATHGSLVVMVSTGTTPSDDTIFWTIVKDGNWKQNDAYKGSGICKVEGSNLFSLTICNIKYTFNGSGNPISNNASGWKLLMGTLTSEVLTTGNVGSTTSGTTYTRSAEGDIRETESFANYTKVLVDNLSPRDQFAMQALRGLLTHIDSPSTMSDNEINFYCEVAYQWAANMMTAAANARAGFTDEEVTVTNSEASVSSFENNTEKLINNIAVALKRTDAVIGTEPSFLAYWKKDGEDNVTGAEEDEVAQRLPTSAAWKAQHDQEPYSGVSDAKADGWTHVPSGTNVAILAERIVNPLWNSRWDDYVKHTPGQGETNNTVGLDDLIKAIRDISVEGGSSTVNVDLSTLNSAIQNGYMRVNNDGSMYIQSGGLGTDTTKTFHVTVDNNGFPSRDILGAVFTAENIHDFLTFNSPGAVGYSTKEEVKKAILAAILANSTDKESIINAIVKTYVDPVTIYTYQDGGTKIKAQNINIGSISNWDITGLDLSPYRRIKCYVTPGASSNMITPTAIVEVVLDDKAKNSDTNSHFSGSAIFQYLNNDNRLYAVTFVVSSDKKSICFLRQTSIYGTAGTSAVDNTRYLYKVEGYYY